MTRINAWAMGAAILASLFTAPIRADEPTAPLRVVVWDERQPEQKQVYPNFLGAAIAEHLGRQPGMVVRSFGLDDAEQGLADDVLDNCDVLIWWGHRRHHEVKAAQAEKIAQRIEKGQLSLIALHSAHWAKPFQEAMNRVTLAQADAKFKAAPHPPAELKTIPAPKTIPRATDPLTPRVEWNPNKNPSVAQVYLPRCVFPAWRADGKPSEVRVLAPKHPIAAGLPAKFEIAQTEMYNEPFHVPTPDLVLLEEHWAVGEHFRSGCLWKLGQGWVFYFRPGHETYPVYKDPNVLNLLTNAVRWTGKRPAGVDAP